uniref:Uncharacterized protein n=1 Tax=Anguilla anguilla TaxID=7936 RepID=A0A0E9W7D9_ANGAN
MLFFSLKKKKHGLSGDVVKISFYLITISIHHVLVAHLPSTCRTELHPNSNYDR